MTILLDTYVVLDILLNRKPWYINAALIFGMAQQNIIKGYISASTITDLFYITAKENGKNNAREAIKRLLNVFYPATVTDKNIYQALELDWDDFEDSIQFIVGSDLSVDYIVTRNTNDFTSSSIYIVTPEQFIQTITDIADDN
jgi:predicted nucleic acid-binding protein